MHKQYNPATQRFEEICNPPPWHLEELLYLELGHAALLEQGDDESLAELERHISSRPGT